MADLYQLLSVPRDASDIQLRAAYRRMLRRVHPDQYVVGSLAHRRASALTRATVAAWDVLGEPASRAAYDASLDGEPLVVPVQRRPPVDAPAQEQTGPRPDPVTHRRYADVLAGPRSSEVFPLPTDPAVGQLDQVLRLVVDGAGPAPERAAALLRETALDELTNVRARAGRAPDRVVASAALATAHRELAARHSRPQPLVDAVAASAQARLGAPAGAVAPVDAAPRARTAAPSRRGFQVMTWVAGVIWAVVAGQVLGDTAGASGPASAWLGDVGLVVGLGMALVGPWWLLAHWESTGAHD